MPATDNRGSSRPYSAFNAGGVTVKEEEVPQLPSKGKEDIATVPPNRTRAPRSKDKGVQYLVLSVVGYVCATIVFGFLLNKQRKNGGIE